ncbi:MAG TPA: Rnase Y domain-containing protein, partial [Candidatus Angelobacter sp.]|nr:Rnase Y domain-containing protein [Candidatus Angelobacter sp.]
MSPLAVVFLVLAAGLATALVVVTGQARRRIAELERDRATAVSAGVEAELARRAQEAEAHADRVRSAALDDAERTRSLAAQSLAAAEQARTEAGEDVRRAEERRALVESDISAARAEISAARSEITAARDEVARVREEAQRREDRLAEREARLDSELMDLADRRAVLERHDAELAERAAVLAAAEDAFVVERAGALERVAGLTAEAAKAEVVASVEAQAKREAALTVRDIEREAREEGEERARRIVTLAAQRIASEQTAESTVAVLHLPDDSMKGRIIGREGRNIRTFEAVTGVNLLIDDTPEAVLLSSFDPVRREVARITLEALVADGRIQPSRIE